MNKEKQREQRGRTCTPVLDHTDLRQIVGGHELVHLTLEAVQQLDKTQPGWNTAKSHEFEPRMMMTLVCYSYASGIYGSEQVVEAIQKIERIHYICARTYPDKKAIRSFRKEHRNQIRQCLEMILQSAWGRQITRVATDNTDRHRLQSRLTERVALDSQHRLDVASFIDLMESDED